MQREFVYRVVFEVKGDPNEIKSRLMRADKKLRESAQRSVRLHASAEMSDPPSVSLWISFTAEDWERAGAVGEHLLNEIVERAGLSVAPVDELPESGGHVSQVEDADSLTSLGFVLASA